MVLGVANCYSGTESEEDKVNSARCGRDGRTKGMIGVLTESVCYW